MKLEQATRTNSFMKLAIFGCSGSGKTYSALQPAKGLTKNNQIAVIETEAGSSTALYDIPILSIIIHILLLQHCNFVGFLLL